MQTLEERLELCNASMAHFATALTWPWVFTDDRRRLNVLAAMEWLVEDMARSHNGIIQRPPCAPEGIYEDLAVLG